MYEVFDPFHNQKLYLFTIAVANYKNYTCHHHRPVTSNVTTGYISTIPLDDSGGGHGSSRCPLVIQGQPGQRINITAYRLVHLTYLLCNETWILFLVKGVSHHFCILIFNLKGTLFKISFLHNTFKHNMSWPPNLYRKS